MRAIWTKTRSDLRRRKLQTLVIALVILLSSGAATMALSLLVESDAPYDHAFAQANGPHLTLRFAAGVVSFDALRATAHAHGVTAAAGPWPEVNMALSTSATQSGKFGNGPGPLGTLNIVGRDRPDTSVDRLTIESGRWARAMGEIVLSQRVADRTGLGIGDHVTADSGAGRTPLTVVGIAASIDPNADGWVAPQQIHALVSPTTPLDYLMMYRVNPAGTSAELRTATEEIASHLPLGAVQQSNNYLNVKRSADLTTAVMVPFLLAFSAFALLAAVLIIANIVTGVVIASYREIGIMKSVGFTPGQVMLVLLGQILAPTLAGSLIGVPLGTVASQPFLQQTAHALGLPAPFTAVISVDLFVFAAIGAVAACAALVPARRAGRLSAVGAITMGTAPAAGRGSGLGRTLSQLPLPRPISLGLGDAAARPLRSTTTMGAILIGVATVVFALGLHLSLGQVAGHLIRDKYVQVDVSRPVAGQQGGVKTFHFGPPLPPAPPVTDRQVTTLLQADPGTARFVAEAQDQVVVPGIAEPIPFYAYRGASDWLGYAMISGRWFSGPDEVVAPTKLLQQARLTVGETITAHLHGQAMRLRIVGEIFDQQNDDLLLRGDWTTLTAVDPSVQPTDYEIQLHRGVDPGRYAGGLFQALGGESANGLDVRTVENSGENTAFILLNSVIAGLALVLTTIAVAGVFNTVVLTTREKVRDVAILKAVGMAPRQVVAMVVSSVAMLGLIAGGLGIPVGLELHRQILQIMGQIATGTAIPPSFFDLIGHGVLPLLALAGVAIASLGAWLPAQWAASSGVAEVLQSE